MTTEGIQGQVGA